MNTKKSNAKIHILTTLGNTGRSGAQTFMMNVLREIDKELFQIDFVVEKDPPNGYHDEIVSYGSKIWIAPRFKIYNWLPYRKKYTEIIKAGNYDIIHGNVSSTAIVYLSIAKKLGCSTILHSHSNGYRGNSLEVLIKKAFSKNAKDYADYWFACSDEAGIRLFGDNLQSGHYYKIRNGIIPEKYIYDEKVRNKIRKQYGISDDEFVIGNVGTFSEAKNHIFLLEVFEKTLKSNCKCKLLLCGIGPLEERIKRYASELGVTNSIIFAGNVPNINEYYMAMDVFAFPSKFEGLGIVAIEAQATGLRCLCSPGVPSEVNITGLCEFISLDDKNRWVTKLLDVNNNNSDTRKSRIEEIRKAGYDIQDTVKILTELYKNMAQ